MDEYACKWMFKFGINKTKVLCVNCDQYQLDPVLYLNGDVIESVSKLEVLGINFDKCNDSSHHVSVRMETCRRAFYGLRDVGMAIPGVNTDVNKSYLWNTVCQPVLTYGLDCVNSTFKKLETCQGNLLKQCLGLSKV